MYAENESDATCTSVYMYMCWSDIKPSLLDAILMISELLVHCSLAVLLDMPLQRLLWYAPSKTAHLSHDCVGTSTWRGTSKHDPRIWILISTRSICFNEKFRKTAFGPQTLIFIFPQNLDMLENPKTQMALKMDSGIFVVFEKEIVSKNQCRRS